MTHQKKDNIAERFSTNANITATTETSEHEVESNDKTSSINEQEENVPELIESDSVCDAEIEEAKTFFKEHGVKMFLFCQ